jgi:hypothetical protein
MKKSFLAILAIPFLLVSCGEKDNGGNNSDNTTPVGGQTIQPSDKAKAFKDKANEYHTSFEITLKDPEVEGNQFMTYGCYYYEGVIESIYFIQSERAGTGFPNYSFSIYNDRYNEGEYISSSVFDGSTQTPLGSDEYAFGLVKEEAYLGQESISSSTNKESASLLGHACDKYVISSFDGSATYYISKQFGFSLQCEYNSEGESGYLFQLEAITLGSCPMLEMLM